MVTNVIIHIDFNVVFFFADILLGIVPSSTQLNSGVKGHSCTLHQRSSSELVSGGSEQFNKSPATGMAPPTSTQVRRGQSSESCKLEGITRQQLAWLEQQEVKPGHFTDAYIRNLTMSSRPLFSLKKMEVQDRETHPKMAHRDRDKKGSSERKKSKSVIIECEVETQFYILRKNWC